jgi:hypothetical protein
MFLASVTCTSVLTASPIVTWPITAQHTNHPDLPKISRTCPRVRERMASRAQEGKGNAKSGHPQSNNRSAMNFLPSASSQKS